MTGREANEYIGRRALLRGERGLQVEVKIDDWKTAYARDLFLVIPVAGSGSAWVTLDSLEVR